ncbi:hypothetical protein MRB53_026515 [Persea americana]|uniref:Uncharacterized protein n=1 Tax=Persea americana TaxID=3435 RepID=A0ACC2LJG4_PERAE|nr:hypothetical protein MRB53_026515 [Persea americana]
MLAKRPFLNNYPSRLQKDRYKPSFTFKASKNQFQIHPIKRTNHSQNQNQILHSNNLIWSSTIPRNEPTTEAVASVPIVGEGSSGKRANQRHRNKNARELLNDAQKKLKRKMKNRESATRSRERKKAYAEQLEIDIEELKSEAISGEAAILSNPRPSVILSDEMVLVTR